MNLVFDGNSLTSNGTYPNAVISDLAPGHSANVSASGQATHHMRQFARLRVYPLRRPEDLNIVIAWEIGNSLATGWTAAESYSLIKNYCLECKAEGFQVVVVSPSPRDFPGTPAGYEADRQTVLANLRADFNVATAYANSFLPSGTGFYADAFADIAADSRIGDAGDENNATYYVDKLHFTTAGYEIVAGIVSDAIRALMGSP